jgi:predicted dehydrogenase
MDIGCYPVTVSRFIFGEEPLRVIGLIERDPDMKIDRLTSGIFEFPAGQSSFTCSTHWCPISECRFTGRAAGSKSKFPSTLRMTGRAGSRSMTAAMSLEVA